MATLSRPSTMNARPIQSGPLSDPSASTDDRNFWGMTVEPGKSKKVKFKGDRLCVTQATLGRRLKNVPKRNRRACLYVKRGRRPPLCVCSLRIKLLEMWGLDLLYKSPCKIRFINHGCYSIHLIGYSYFLPTPHTSSPIDTTHVAEEETLQEPVFENGGHGHNTILLNECGTLVNDQENRVGETASIFPEDDQHNITTTIPEAKECDGKDGSVMNAHGRIVCALEIPKERKSKMKNVEAQSVSDTKTVLEEVKEADAENGGHAHETISLNESETVVGEKNKVEEVVLVECATKDGGDEEHSHVHESIPEIVKKKRKKMRKIAGESVGLEQTEQPPKKKRKRKYISRNDTEKIRDTTNAVEELLKEPVAENGGHSHQNDSINGSEKVGVQEHRIEEAVSEDINVNISNIVREIENAAAKDVDDEEHHHTLIESDKNACESSEISKKKRKKNKTVESESASLAEAEEIGKPRKSRRKEKGVSGNKAEISRSGVGEGENPTNLSSRQADTEELFDPTPLSVYVPMPEDMMKEKLSHRDTTNAVEELLKEPVAENGGHSHQNDSINGSETVGVEEHRIEEAVSEDINVNIFNIVREIENAAAKDVHDVEHPRTPIESDKNACERHASSEISKKKQKKSKKVESESASVAEAEEIGQPRRSKRNVKGISGNKAEKSHSGVGEGENPTSLSSRQVDTEEILDPTPLSIYVPMPSDSLEQTEQTPKTKRKGKDISRNDAEKIRLSTNEHQVSFAATHGAATWSQSFVLALNARAKDHAAPKNCEDPRPSMVDEHDIRFEMFRR